MRRRIGYFLSDVRHWFSERLNRRQHGGLLLALAGVVLLVGVAIAVVLILEIGEDEEVGGPAPRIVIRETKPQPEASEDLGFPEFATSNTTRVAGGDAIADAAGVALAAFPSAGGLSGPAAVSLVEEGDWPGGIAVSSLVARPIGAPVLVSAADDVPDLTLDALSALAPRGRSNTNGRQIFRIGDAAVPLGRRTLDLEGRTPAKIAAEVARARERLTGKDPEHVLLASSEKPAYAMPAASWAARSGDPVLFLKRKAIPKPTVDTLQRLEGVPVYVLGPISVISPKMMEGIREVAPNAQRVGKEGPIENAIAFARYVDGTFGWDINDPGHGFVIASTERPLDAAAAAPLSAGGTWGPLLLTDDPEEVPAPLRGYLRDLKPGYEDDPTRAVYNHVWLIGDQNTISVNFQARIDELAEVARVRSRGGGSVLGAPPGTRD